MYEIVLTRLLSVLCWYYLAFVSISMAMFGMTAGALAVQFRPGWFEPTEVSRRLAQAAFATGVSMPVALLIMFAVPVDISLSAETLCRLFRISAAAQSSGRSQRHLRDLGLALSGRCLLCRLRRGWSATPEVVCSGGRDAGGCRP
jgi:hypothetical protein